MSELMQGFADFLAFRSLVTPGALVAFYYLGAILMPLAAWGMARRLRRHLPSVAAMLDEGMMAAWSAMPPSQRLQLGLLFLGCFLCMELIWRMMFEFMLTYFQIYEALLKMAPAP